MKKKVLVIDDTPLVYVIFQTKLFKDFDFEYKQIPDPFNTQSVIEEYKPDLIILDVKFNLPIDGVEIGRFIKSKHNIPIIYHSAVDEEEAKYIIDEINPAVFILKHFHYSKEFNLLLYSIIKGLLNEKSSID